MKGNDSPSGRKDDQCIPIPGARGNTKPQGPKKNYEECAHGGGYGCRRGCKYLVDDDKCDDCQGHDVHQPTPEEQIQEYQEEHGLYRIPKAMDSYKRRASNWFRKACQKEKAGPCLDAQGHCCCNQGLIFDFSSRECVDKPNKEEKALHVKVDLKKEEPDVDSTQEDPEEEVVDEAAPKSARWSNCEKRNAHECYNHPGKCCCNVGTSFTNNGCVESGQGDQDPKVKEHQIPESKGNQMTCSIEGLMHRCGTGCCCNGELKYVAESGKCEEKPQVEKPPEEKPRVETPRIVVEVNPDLQDLQEDGVDNEAPEKWSSCEKNNAHKCFVGKCCCNVGTDYERGKGCVKSPEGDKDPRVEEHQIPNSRNKHKFHSCSMKRNMHPCGTGCCCNRAFTYVVEIGKCEDSPSKTGPKAFEKPVMDPAPPKEDPIPGSQFWTSSGGTCEAKEAYGCGTSATHCCCRFGCEFQEIYDKCGSCKDEAPKVKVNMIPASQLWESRVKRGICNARGSHPCGPGCCCNAGFTWSKENRRCEQSNPTLQDGLVQAPASTDGQSSPTPSPPGSASTGASEKSKNGSIRAGHLAMSLLLLPLVWIRSSC